MGIGKEGGRNGVRACVRARVRPCARACIRSCGFVRESADLAFTWLSTGPKAHQGAALPSASARRDHDYRIRWVQRVQTGNEYLSSCYDNPETPIQ